MSNRFGLSLLAVVLGLSGCASRPQFLEIQTTPPGAEVRIAGEVVGAGPVRYDLQDKPYFTRGKQVVTVEMPGYQRASRTLMVSDFKSPGNKTRDSVTGKRGVAIHVHLLKDPNSPP